MAGQQEPDDADDGGRDQDGTADGNDVPNQDEDGLGLPSDSVPTGRLKRNRRPKVVREHPIATLIVAILVALITAAGSITAAVITKTPDAKTGGSLYSGDDSAFCGDVTYPDHSYVTVGKKFVKKWMLCNTGSVAWTGRFLVPSGQDIGSCDYPVRVRVPETKPGQKAIIAVTVTPLAAGRCKVPWKMVNADDQFCFPADEGVWFDVVARKAPG